MVINEGTDIHVVKLKHCLFERNVPIGYDFLDNYNSQAK